MRHQRRRPQDLVNKFTRLGCYLNKRERGSDKKLIVKKINIIQDEAYPSKPADSVTPKEKERATSASLLDKKKASMGGRVRETDSTEHHFIVSFAPPAPAKKRPGSTDGNKQRK